MAARDKNYKFGWLRGSQKLLKGKNFWLRGLQPSELFSSTIPLPDDSRGGLNKDQPLIAQRIFRPQRQSSHMQPLLER
jgi:hypothetical protein